LKDFRGREDGVGWWGREEEEDKEKRWGEKLRRRKRMWR
jgi:hypothetical protein